ncbi:MAG: HlyD family type I secretion periplasmic adaptor subunit [Proteobacteria bacterium]|nr:HlyD family type I secretion periplasmic adaptor subunit [Pseudomonadota bacterium]MDA1023875.1 HlyD family type I secretion periplasmic adaptor subunit [Pseudomonadota bacterium]
MSELSASKTDMPSGQMILRGDRRPRVMAQSASFGEETGPRLMLRAGIIVGAGVVALALWGGFVEIDDAVTAKGEVIPAGDIQSLRHPDGGMVGEILVSEGETVKKGQVLLRLEADEAKARLLSLQNEKARTELMAAGLRALGQGGEPDYSFVSVAYKPLADHERRVFTSLRNLTEKRRQVWAGRVKRAERKLKNIAKREERLSKKSALLEEEVGLRKDLFKKGLTAKDVYLKAKKDFDTALKDLADLAIAKKQTGQDLRQARKQSGELDIRLKERALDDLGVLTSQLDALNETIETLKDKLGRLDIEAPVGGIVRGVKKHPLGALVGPSDVILEILPSGGGVRIETRISVKDMERVAAGQKVIVRVKAPGFGRFGGIPGTLKEISPSTFEDKNAKTYHRGIVTVSRDSFGHGAAEVRMTPGMTAETSIRTGSKRLYRYFWD